jgi:hypothetical protein
MIVLQKRPGGKKIKMILYQPDGSPSVMPPTSKPRTCFLIANGCSQAGH